MSWRSWLREPRTRLDVVAGLVDGVLNALTLAAGRMLAAAGADLGLAVRVALATGLTTLFVFFMAHYAEERAELARAERELNLAAHGRLAASRLGRRAIQNSILGATLAAACGVAGALGSLLLCAFLPGPRWSGLMITIGLLGVLGAFLAHSVRGSAWRWASGVMLGGVALTAVGVKLNIAG